MHPVRLTLHTARILRALMDDPPRYGSELMDQLHLGSGTLFPALARLEAAGVVVSALEQIAPGQDRPPRRYYRLTAEGGEFARRELAALAGQLAPPPQGGPDDH